MDKKLEEMHKEMESLFSEAYEYGKSILNFENVRQELTGVIKKLEEIYWDEVFISVNNQSVSKELAKFKRIEEIGTSLSKHQKERKSFYEETNNEIKEKKENIKNNTNEISRISKKYNLENHVKHYVNIKENNSSALDELKREFNKFLKDYANKNKPSNIKNDINKLTTKYNDLVFSFNRNNGEGWYDYCGQYRMNNAQSYTAFKQGLERLIDKGFDIKIIADHSLRGGRNVGEIAILTNTGNIRKIHDIVYNDCNPKRVDISGRFITPNLGKEFDSNILKSFPISDYDFSEMIFKSKNALPSVLKEQFTSSVDAYGYTKGLPQKSLLSSMLSKEVSGARHSISEFNGNPLKMAFKSKESKNVENYLNDKNNEIEKQSKKSKLKRK